MFGIKKEDDGFLNYTHVQNVKNLRFFSIATCLICALLFIDNSGPIEGVKYNHIINYTNLAGVFFSLFAILYIILTIFSKNSNVQKITVWLGVISGYAMALAASYMDIIQGSGVTILAIVYIMIAVIFSARLFYLISVLIINAAFFYYVVSQIETIQMGQYNITLATIVILSTLVSITLERQRREVFISRRNLVHKIDELNNALDVKATFFGHMSHELRTPLNAIIGFSDMLRQSDPKKQTNEKTLEYAEYIHTGGIHLLTLVNDLLDQNKIETGEVKIKLEKLNIAKLMQNYIDELLPISNSKNQTIDLSITDDQLFINSDSRHFKQIIYNVLSNAQKYSPSDSRITIKISPSNLTSVVINIIDTGKGMPQEVIDQIIHSNSPVKSHFISHAEGTGLGLIIVRQLMIRLHGTVNITLEKKRGTNVELTFPIHFS